MNAANRILLVLLACWIAVLPACWAFGPPRTSTEAERSGANTTVAVAEETGYLTRAEGDELRRLIDDSGKNPQSWSELWPKLVAVGLASLAASQAMTTARRGPPEKVRRKDAEIAALRAAAQKAGVVA